ncbi:MAG: long-chain-fatty-acid--CoA ligase [Actinomycetota bacterium]
MSLSLAAVLAEAAQRYPDRTATILGTERTSYADLWAQARRYAAVLRDRGVGPGDRVALLVPNVTDFPRLYYGALALGAVVVPVHALLTADEIAYVLRDSGARLLAAAGPLVDTGAKAAELAGIPLLATMVPPGAAPGAALDRVEDAAAALAPVDSYLAGDPSDDAVILYTSGTTGRPKGAVLSHLNLVLNATLAATDVVALRPGEDVILGCLPLFHSFGQTCTMNAGFRAGATVVLMPRFDGTAALELMAAHGVTVFQGVPTMYLGLLDAVAHGATPVPLRIACSGGASLPVAVIDRFAEVFGADILEGYGLSETSPVATFNQQVYGRRPGSVGHAIWGVDVEVARAEVEERIELLPRGELGEIVIRGHNVMTRYHNNPEATAGALVDGWFRTGDLGTKGADGFVTIVDRKKDMVLRGGFNVYPREVEEVLARHPAVAQVAVIGLPDPTYGEEVCAVVRPAGDAEGSAELAAEIVTWSRQHLGGHKYPRQVRFVTEFPLGPSGKVLKRELVARYRAAD